MTELSYGINGGEHAWVGIDPGITTGWAVLADDGRPHGHGTFVEENVYDGLDLLIRGLHRAGLHVTAVVEQMPGVGKMSDLQQRLERVRQIVTEIVEEVYDLPVIYVAPGEWKTSRVAKLARPKARTQHERDAIVMTAYAIAKEARRPNG